MRFVWKCGIFYSILYNLIRVGLIWRDFIMRLDLCVGIFSSGSCFVFKTWCFIGVTFCTASCHFFFVCLSLLPWIFEYICALPSFALSSLVCWLESNYSPFSFLFSVKLTFRVHFLSALVGRIGAATNNYFHYRLILFCSFIVSVINFLFCPVNTLHLLSYVTQKSSTCSIVLLEERLKHFLIIKTVGN